MKNCYLCGGTLKREEVNITRYWGTKLVALENVPAMICRQCGERYFEAKVSEQIDQKIKKGLQEKNFVDKIVVPVLHF